MNRLTVIVIVAAGITVGASNIAIGQNKADLTPGVIDQMIRTEWKKEGVAPSPRVDDARFLRRIYLDLTGTIPTEEAVRAFLADRSPEKRAKAVDQLLSCPKYSENWTNYWDQVLMGRQLRAQVIDRMAWRGWLRSQFDKNIPWNRFVYDLISATGVNSAGGSIARANGIMLPSDKQAMEKPSDEGGGGMGGKVNPAVNWFLKYAQSPADLSGQASKIFLGVQIQCAQCHDHKTEKWKQEDFRRFTACFMNARPVPAATYKKGMVRQLDVIESPRTFVPRNRKGAEGRAEYASAPPAALDGTDFASTTNRRQALAAWMTAPENPWFAEAIVNRMWSHFLGRGFVEPVDDFRPSNPAVMPDLMKKLADDFVARDYDLKHLAREICATEVYQLSSQPAKSAGPGNTLWARYRLKPMGPEEMLDSLVTATKLEPALQQVAGGNLDTLKTVMVRQLNFLFDVDEEFEQKDFEGTIPQALMLLNGNLTNRAVTAIPGTTLKEVWDMEAGDSQRIETLYLRTLSRKPTSPELTKWTEFVNAPRELVVDGRPQQPVSDYRQRQLAKMAQNRKPIRRNAGPDPFSRIGGRLSANATPKLQAYEDLFWALLNSSEFTFNH